MFDDVLVIPTPRLAPSMTKVDNPELIDQIWAEFITPLKESFEAVNQTLEDAGEPPEPLPDHVRLLMAVLRSVKAGLDPEGSGWENLRKASVQARAEFESEQAAQRTGASIAERIKDLVGDLNEVGDAYVEGVRDAYEIAAGVKLSEPSDN